MKIEYNLMKELKRLGSIRGSGTELITIYIPAGGSISDTVAKLRDEHGQASNIKSKSTKTNVQGAIDKIMQYLKLYKQPPKNGLAIFCGNISTDPSKIDIELFSVETPQPIKVNIYRCDSEFLLDPIQAMADAKDSYALVIMDGREATVALLKGAHVTVEKRITSFAHAKIHKGGQSANRYQRLIEESIEDFYKRIGDSVNNLYVKHSFKVKGLIVGGPGPAKENFVRAKTLNYQIKVLGVFDTGYTDESAGVNELLEKAKEVLKEQEAIQERTVMERFLNEVARSGLVVSGYEAVKREFQKGNVIKLIISEGLDLTEVTYKCTNCGQEVTYLEKDNTRHEKHECGGNLDVISRHDAVESIIEKADAKGIDIVFVSEESQYGRELLMGFDGIAAMLKYKPG